MPRKTKNTEVAAIETSIEGHVAGRIRLRRGLLGMSQSDLARMLGITFQQVQKYERGSNRVSVGKLFRLAEILDVPLTFFFDGLDMPGYGRGEGVDGTADGQSPILSRRELDVLHAWKVAPPTIADAVASLLRSVTSGQMVELDDLALAPVTVARASATAPATAAPADHKVPSVDMPAPKRRGRPPKAAKLETTAAANRRRRNAIWDPSDIMRASREKT